MTSSPVSEWGGLHAQYAYGEDVHAVEWLKNRGYRTLCRKGGRRRQGDRWVTGWVNTDWGKVVRPDDQWVAVPELTCSDCLEKLARLADGDAA